MINEFMGVGFLAVYITVSGFAQSGWTQTIDNEHMRNLVNLDPISNMRSLEYGTCSVEASLYQNEEIHMTPRQEAMCLFGEMRELDEEELWLYNNARANDPVASQDNFNFWS